jgi:hypothetical protein
MTVEKMFTDEVFDAQDGAAEVWSLDVQWKVRIRRVGPFWYPWGSCARSRTLSSPLHLRTRFARKHPCARERPSRAGTESTAGQLQRIRERRLQVGTHVNGVS